MSHSVRSVLIVAGTAFCSRVLGFGRDLGMAWLLGSGPAADALSAALRLPYLGRRLLGEGTLSMPLTALCSRSPQRAARLALAAARRTALGAGLLTAAGLVFAGPLAMILAPGLDAAGREQTVVLLRLCLPYLFFAALAAGHMAALHAYSRFLLPGLTPGLFNIVTLLFIAAAFFLRAEGGETFLHAAELPAAGVLCGGIAQWLVQAPAAHRLRRAETGPAPDKAEIRNAVCRMPAGMLAAAMPQAAFAAAGCLASFLPTGHMAALFYAERLIEFPLGVTGAAIGIAAAPALAGLAAQNKTERLRLEADRAVRLALLLNLPAAAGIAAVALPLTSTLFGHGAFNAEAVNLTASALWGYAPGLPAYALSRPLLALCQAKDDRSTPLRAALTGFLFTLAAGATLTALNCSAGPAVSAGLWCNTALLWHGAAPRIGLSLPGRFIARQLAAALFTFSAATIAVAAAARLSLPPPLGLLLAVVTGLLAHAVAFPAQDRHLLLLLRKKRRSRPQQPLRRSDRRNQDITS